MASGRDRDSSGHNSKIEDVYAIHLISNEFVCVCVSKKSCNTQQKALSRQSSSCQTSKEYEEIPDFSLFIKGLELVASKVASFIISAREVATLKTKHLPRSQLCWRFFSTVTLSVCVVIVIAKNTSCWGWPQLLSKNKVMLPPPPFFSASFQWCVLEWIHKVPDFQTQLEAWDSD